MSENIQAFFGLLLLIGIIVVPLFLVHRYIKRTGQKTFFQPLEDNKKWWQLRRMGKKEYGYTAIIGLLGGWLLNSGLWTSGLWSKILGDTLFLIGLIYGIIWIVKIIWRKG